MGAWRNGNRRGLKILCPQGLAGSTPAAPTILPPAARRPSGCAVRGVQLPARDVPGRRLHLTYTADIPLPRLVAPAPGSSHRASRPSDHRSPSRAPGRLSSPWCCHDRQCLLERLVGALPAARRRPKHQRPIILEPWQRSIVEQQPSEFLRGCIESDGCRHRRIVGGRNYPAYSFTNHSEDILRLFVWACGLIGVRPRRANRVTISIARRTDVATLDSIVGDNRS